MKLTFPHMGNLFIPVKALLDDLGVAYVLPEESTAGTLEIGTRLVPEGACLPLKIFVGTLLKACSQGAGTIAIVSGLGPCRFGYYCQMQREILTDAGFPTEAIHFTPLRGDYAGLIRKLHQLTGSRSLANFALHVPAGVRITRQVDALERKYHWTQPREKQPGQTHAVYRSFQHKARNTLGTRDMLRLLENTRCEMADIELDPAAKPLRVGIVGEIYDIIDPFACLYLQEKLGRMGVEVYRPITVSDWITQNWSLLPRRGPSFQQAAKPYLKCAIGGHTQETLGHAVLMAKDGYDGIIQIYPMGCMPEIVAQGILPTLSMQENIPVLTLVLDEMTGEAGVMTRVEAFLDLLMQRRASRHEILADSTPAKRSYV